MQSGPWLSLQSSEVIVKLELLDVDGVAVAVGTGVDVAVGVGVAVATGAEVLCLLLQTVQVQLSYRQAVKRCLRQLP